MLVDLDFLFGPVEQTIHEHNALPYSGDVSRIVESEEGGPWPLLDSAAFPNNGHSSPSFMLVI